MAMLNAPSPQATNMKPNWLQVEYAITFFISFWKNPTDAAKNAVSSPIMRTKVIIKSDMTINSENLTVKKTPAVTIVAAWINAETGVGPSIASGNQVWKPNWADFPIAPIKRKKHEKTNALILKPKKLIS